jgi:hypothetical protein
MEAKGRFRDTSISLGQAIRRDDVIELLDANLEQEKNADKPRA